MIKLIPIEKLQPGMYVHDLNCSWMEHNFVRSRFAVKDEAVVRKVRAIGTHEIYIDTARGLDLPEAPTREEIEHEVDEKIDAIAAEAAPRIAAQEVACEIERARTAPRGQSHRPRHDGRRAPGQTDRDGADRAARRTHRRLDLHPAGRADPARPAQAARRLHLPALGVGLRADDHVRPQPAAAPPGHPRNCGGQPCCTTSARPASPTRS